MELAQKVKLRELEIEEKQGSLIDREMALRYFTAVVTTAKSRFMGLPAKMRSQVPKLSVADVEWLDREIRQILNDLATWRPGEDYDFEAAEAVDDDDDDADVH